jgi:hypothetical protein
MNRDEMGVNILTSSRSVIVDGAEELIEEFYKGNISAEYLYKKLLESEVVYVDRSLATQFKGDEEPEA